MSTPFLGNTLPLYEVSLWLVDPDEEELDDSVLVGSRELLTKDFAWDCFNNPEKYFSSAELKRAIYISFDWDEAFRCRRLDSKMQSRMERSEAAMQAGMMGGCEAYNEEMGWRMDTGDDDGH
jgi:hypothetical protein